MPNTLVPFRTDLARQAERTRLAADADEQASFESCAQLIDESHTPLAAIRGSVQLLRRRVANGDTDVADVADGLQRIDEAATRLGELLGELGDPAFRESHGRLALSTVLEMVSVVGAVRAGAVRFLLNEGNAQESWQAIKAAVAGQVRLSSEPAARFTHEAHTLESVEQLSQRELEVLRLLARGRSNKRIARDLTIAENTVKTHASSILGKLGVESRTQAALYAGQIGLLPGPQPDPADAFAA